MPIMVRFRRDPNEAIRKIVEELRDVLDRAERLSACDFVEIFDQPEPKGEGEPE